MRKHWILFSLLLFNVLFVAAATTVSSPDARLVVTIDLVNGKLVYRVNYDGKPVIEPSELGVLTNEGDFSRELVFVEANNEFVEKNYVQDRIKKSSISYRANGVVVKVENAEQQKMSVRFQVSNNDVAFRYELEPMGERLACVVLQETTGYTFPPTATGFLSNMMGSMGAFARTSPSYESGYTNDVPVGDQTRNKDGYVFPALFRIAGDGWVLLSETGVSSNYCASHLSPSSGGGFKLQFPAMSQNNGVGSNTVQMGLPGATPWRTITVGRTLKPIVETTIPFDLVEPLYAPSRSYRPGRASWSWIVWQDQSMNWADQIQYVDLAAAMGYEYILIDALWDTNIGYERMKELIRYADSKQVGVFLWYNSNGGFNDAPQTPKNKMHNPVVRRKEMKWLQEAGVKGLKVDFFGGDKQETMRLYEDILVDADEHGLMIVFHGCTLPRGWERMYPNFVGSEAVLASEMLVFSQYVRDNEAFFATLHPFIRNAVGSMEFGGVFLNKFLNRSNRKGAQRLTTDAFQLATAVLFQSPMQMFALTPNNLQDAPSFAVDFMKEIPASWDETVYVDGYPGKYIVLARRHNTDWYLGAVSALNEPLKLKLDLPMFAGKQIRLISDDKTKISTRSQSAVPADGSFEITVQPKGGCVIY